MAETIAAPPVGSRVDSAAGFVLATLFWGWVALPFIFSGGLDGVRTMLMAKFLNKDKNGKALP